MKLPVGLFLEGIGEKKIYYFRSSKISSELPHFFICVKRTTQDFLIMSCCTTKLETIQRFVELRKLSYRTIVYLKPDGENALTEDTYINCNGYIPFTVEEFKSLYLDDRIDFVGEVSDIHYGQIIVGLHESTLVDDETKDLLPPYQQYI